MLAAWTFRTLWLLAFVHSGEESAGILPAVVLIVAQAIAHSEQGHCAEGQQRRHDDMDKGNGKLGLHTNTSFKKIRESRKRIRQFRRLILTNKLKW